jgi:hypothetical protein
MRVIARNPPLLARDPRSGNTVVVPSGTHGVVRGHNPNYRFSIAWNNGTISDGLTRDELNEGVTIERGSRT